MLMGLDSHGVQRQVYPGSQYLLYKVDGVKTVTRTTLAKKEGDGVATDIDLYEGPAPYHSGYMLQDITKNTSTALNCDIFGHYLHTVTPTWISGISISVGEISITGPVVDSDYKTDQFMTWP